MWRIGWRSLLFEKSLAWQFHLMINEKQFEQICCLIWLCRIVLGLAFSWWLILKYTMIEVYNFLIYTNTYIQNSIYNTSGLGFHLMINEKPFEQICCLIWLCRKVLGFAFTWWLMKSRRGIISWIQIYKLQNTQIHIYKIQFIIHPA